jgi:hypothetical protein
MKKQPSFTVTSLASGRPVTEEVLQRLALKTNVSIDAVRTFARISVQENRAPFSAQAVQKAFSRVKTIY